MALTPGEYTFACMECGGEGVLDMGQLDGSIRGESCFVCGGQGQVFLDEEEAAERVSVGHQPLSGPRG